MEAKETKRRAHTRKELRNSGAAITRNTSLRDADKIEIQTAEQMKKRMMAIGPGHSMEIVSKNMEPMKKMQKHAQQDLVARKFNIPAQTRWVSVPTFKSVEGLVQPTLVMVSEPVIVSPSRMPGMAITSSDVTMQRYRWPLPITGVTNGEGG